MARLATIAAVLAFALPAHADDFGGAAVIYARGGALYRADPRGKGELELAKLPAGAGVRALRTDAAGKVLLAELATGWAWMPLDGTAHALTPLPCADGPAELAENGASVLCHSPQGLPSRLVVLATGSVIPEDVPTAGARLVTAGTTRLLVWADASGVWTAPPAHTHQATKVAPAAPLREFLPSPDGKRAVGVYADSVYVDTHHTQPADVLMGFQLDGEAARRKAIKDGVPVEWSHDSSWVLVEDSGSACLMRATGGEYKCWKGFTAESIAPGGKFALFSAERDGKRSLYRAALEGSAYTEPPALIAHDVDGAAVWVPPAP